MKNEFVLAAVQDQDFHYISLRSVGEFSFLNISRRNARGVRKSRAECRIERRKKGGRVEAKKMSENSPFENLRISFNGYQFHEYITRI